jgi:NAD(P)-dependent dehydrogenase (short-subunit alcohol dehydrogenase family)
MYSYTSHQAYTRYTSLADKVVFITGGASGIGASLVEAFSQQGARVAFVDLDEDSALQLQQQLVEAGQPKPWFQACDVKDIDHLRSCIEEVRSSLGNIGVLINNAAVDRRHQVDAISETQWLDSLAVNLHPAFFAAQSVKPQMAALGGGAILNISSLNTRFGPPQMAAYITAKAGLLGMTRALATEFGPDNIRVNAILPGWVATPRQLDTWLTPEAEAEWMSRLCIKKRLGAHDVAKLALFLASDDAAMITAQEYVIDGGRS